jgi:hypothetical protein
MRRLLLALVASLAFAGAAQAQCLSAGGVNSVPVVGVGCLSESNINTYGATSIGLVPAASATDIACITGSATSIVRVLAIRVSGSAGTLVSLPVVITKHASADTGGTAATGNALPVAYKMDPTDATPGASLTAYTANPTIPDASPGLIDAGVVTFNTTASVGGAPLQFAWTTHIYNEPPQLRTVAQQLCVNLNGISITSGLLAISFLWTEGPQ